MRALVERLFLARSVTPAKFGCHSVTSGSELRVRGVSLSLQLSFLLTITMAPFSVQIKHAGKTIPLQLDTDLPPGAFMEAVYGSTGIPVDRMKVMVKGGVLKVSGLLFSVKFTSLTSSQRR